MSNYLEKYHLKKVEPVKSRAKISYQDYMKMQQRPEKTGLVKVAPKRKIPPPHRNYFQKDDPRTPISTPKTEPVSRGEPNLPGELCLSREKRESPPRERVGEGKSLSFKTSKDSSAGAKIINSIQEFFNRMLESGEGCECGEPCPWGSKFFNWVDVPFGIVRSHYQKTLSKWQEQLREEGEGEGRGETGKNLKQVMKDVDRTQSESATFQNAVFKERLKKILMCYACEDGKVGYIQGMNVILSGLLFHLKDEVRTYAVFRKLIYTLRNIYLHSSPAPTQTSRSATDTSRRSGRCWRRTCPTWRRCSASWRWT